MNIELEDIKQLLRAELSASETRTEQRTKELTANSEKRTEGVIADAITASEKRLIGTLASKTDLHELQDAVAQIINTGLEAVDSKEQVNDHERRITRLEHHAT